MELFWGGQKYPEKLQSYITKNRQTEIFKRSDLELLVMKCVLLNVLLHVYISGSKSTDWDSLGAFKLVPQGADQNEKWFNFALISLLC